MNPPRGYDPRSLDVATFALARARLAGDFPLAEMTRLTQDALPPVPDMPAPVVTWSLQGEQCAVAGGQTEIRLELQARTTVQLRCQRCLQPMDVALDVRPRLRFVQGEDLAARLDEESDDDVLALSSELDLHELIEDELILALPLVPRHERCAQPLPMRAEAAVEPDAADTANPFAVLAALRRNPGGEAN
jgi:uncharacterized protein